MYIPSCSPKASILCYQAFPMDKVTAQGSERRREREKKRKTTNTHLGSSFLTKEYPTEPPI